MIINLSSLTGLFVGYRKDFNKGFAAAQPTWQEIASLMPSVSGTNTYPFEGTFPKLRQWVGDRQIKDMRSYSYSLENAEYEGTVEVKRATILNDQYGIFRPKMEQMGYSAGMHPDELVYAQVAAGATNLCYDGQPYFNASHPIVVDGVATTTGNYDSTAVTNLWALLDTTKPLKPFIYQKREPYSFVSLTRPNDEHVFMRNRYVYGVNGHGAAGYSFWQLAYGSLNTLNDTNCDTYVAAMMALKDDEGHPLGIMPDTILVGPSNHAAANRLVNQERLATGESNPYYKRFKILLTPFLT